MSLTNTDIISKLEQLTKKLLFSDSGRVTPFFWNVAERGELTTKNLLLFNQIWSSPSVTCISLESFLETKVQEREKYYYLSVGLSEDKVKYLVDILKSKLDSIEIYLCYYPDAIFDIYIGKTKNNVWFGICTPLNYDRIDVKNRLGANGQSLLTRSSVEPDPDIIELQEMLTAEGFCKDKKEYYKAFRWEIGQSSDEALEKILLSFKFLVIQEFRDIQDFALEFDAELRSIEEEGPWETEIEIYIDPETGEGKEMEVETGEPLYPPSRDYRDLDSFLKSKLTNLRLYAIGAVDCPDFNVYAIGNTPTSDWAGVKLNVNLNV